MIVMEDSLHCKLKDKEKQSNKTKHFVKKFLF